MLDEVYPNLNHVGIVVENISKAGSDDSHRFGLGKVVDRNTLHVEDALYRGRKVSFAAEFGFIDLGNTSLELIQPIGTGPSPYFDTLHEKGESTHHLAYVVSSIDEHLKRAGSVPPAPRIVLDAKLHRGDGRFVYVEGLVHGVLVELIEFFRH